VAGTIANALCPDRHSAPVSRERQRTTTVPVISLAIHVDTYLNLRGRQEVKAIHLNMARITATTTIGKLHGHTVSIKLELELF